MTVVVSWVDAWPALELPLQARSRTGVQSSHGAWTECQLNHISGAGFYVYFLFWVRSNTVFSLHDHIHNATWNAVSYILIGVCTVEIVTVTVSTAVIAVELECGGRRT